MGINRETRNYVYGYNNKYKIKVGYMHERSELMSDESFKGGTCDVNLTSWMVVG